MLDNGSEIITIESSNIRTYSVQDLKISKYTTLTNAPGAAYDNHTICKGDNNSVICGGYYGTVSVYSPQNNS